MLRRRRYSQIWSSRKQKSALLKLNRKFKSAWPSVMRKLTRKRPRIKLP